MTTEPTTKTFDEFQKEFRGRFYAAIAAAIIAGAGAALVAMWGYVQTLPSSVGLVPAGAVVAFDGACPSNGWERYWPATSRAIIGAADANEIGSVPSQFAAAENGLPLTARALKSIAGEEAHKLTVEQLPPHSHQYESETTTNGNRSGIQDATFGRITKETSTVGEGKLFTNMQPSLALTYCVKLK